MELKDFEFKRLIPGYPIKQFNCDDTDLDAFLLTDASQHSAQLFSVTYLLETNTETAAFFTLVNDKIKIEESKSKSFWKSQVSKNIPYIKRKSDYPAVKLGRLGVNNIYKGLGVGTEILDFIKIWFVDKNKTGCRFITVDAYGQSLGFYEKNNFNYLTDKDHGKDTRLMYFDLIRI